MYLYIFKYIVLYDHKAGIDIVTISNGLTNLTSGISKIYGL